MHRHRFHSHFFEGRHGGDRFGGRGGMGGPGSRGGFFERLASMGAGAMRGARLVSSDDLQLIILSLLSEKPRHGYELIKTIGEQSSGIYTPSPGMVYPALTYLEEVGFAVSEMEGTKKLFKISKEGTEHLEKNREHITKVIEQLSRFGEKMAYAREQIQQDEVTDERWGGGPRDQDKKEWRQMRSEFHEVRHELKSALFEKLTAPMEEKKRVLAVLKKAIAEIRKK